LFRTAVKFRHQKDLLAVAVAQRFTHDDFTFAVMIIPAIVHEGDAVVDGSAHDTNAFVLVARITDVRTTEPDRGNFDAGFAERALRNFALWAAICPAAEAAIVPAVKTVTTLRRLGAS
jgi:hypothetical protein